MSLISTDGLESALREILGQLQRQSSEIANVKATLTQCGTKSDLHDLEQLMARRFTVLEKRLDALESETAVDIPLEILEATLSSATTPSSSSSSSTGGARVPIARYIAAHHDHLKSLHIASDLAATRVELEASKREASLALSTALTVVADERASRGAVTELQDAADALQGQVTALQGVLATKVDRAEVIGLRSVAADLATFQGFKAAATADIRELGVKAETHRTAISQTNDTIAKLSEVLQEFGGRLSTKAETKSLERAEADIVRLSTAVSARAFATDLHALEAVVAETKESVGGLEATQRTAANIATEDRKQAEARVAAMASNLRAELTGTADLLRTDIAVLRDEVDARAYVTSLEATDEAVNGLRSVSELLGSKVEVALRFVDWYAERGSAYEHNAAALESHMNALAVGNRARAVDSVGDLQARLGRGGGGKGTQKGMMTMNQAYQPLQSGSMMMGLGGGVANLTSQFTAVGGPAGGGGPMTGMGGTRIGGVA